MSTTKQALIDALKQKDAEVAHLGKLFDEMSQVAQEQSQTAEKTLKYAKQLEPYERAIQTIGDTLIRTGVCQSIEQIGLLGGVGVVAAQALQNAAIDRIASAHLRDDYLGACETIASMHRAAVGSVKGPQVGVVEDVENIGLALRFVMQQFDIAAVVRDRNTGTFTIFKKTPVETPKESVQ